MFGFDAAAVNAGFYTVFSLTLFARRNTRLENCNNKSLQHGHLCGQHTVPPPLLPPTLPPFTEYTWNVYKLTSDQGGNGNRRGRDGQTAMVAPGNQQTVGSCCPCPCLCTSVPHYSYFCSCTCWCFLRQRSFSLAGLQMWLLELG